MFFIRTICIERYRCINREEHTSSVLLYERRTTSTHFITTMRFFSITKIFFLSLLSTSINHATLLWRINVEPPAYLLGTIHIPHPLIWPSMSENSEKSVSRKYTFLSRNRYDEFLHCNSITTMYKSTISIRYRFSFHFQKRKSTKKLFSSDANSSTTSSCSISRFVFNDGSTTNEENCVVT